MGLSPLKRGIVKRAKERKGGLERKFGRSGNADLPPGQSPAKDISPQSAVCWHVPCSLELSQRI